MSTDETAPDEATDESSDVGQPATPARTRRSVASAACAVLVVAALIFAVFGAVSWWRADHDDSLKFAQTRDTVSLAARQDIVVLNDLNYAKLDAGLQSWLGATTGTLHDQISQVSAADKTSITAAKTVTTGRVIAAAVTQLDDRAGSATVIAAVEVTVTPAGGKATIKRNRYSATMTRAGTAWKLSDLQQVAVSVS